MKARQIVQSMRGISYIPIFTLCLTVLALLTSCASTSPLYRASERGDIETVRTLLESKSKTDLDEEGALYAAAWGGNPEIVRLLIEKDADLNFSGVKKEAPLLAAAYKGHADVVRILIDAGADVNATDSDNRGSLHRAVLYGHTDIVRILIDAGADVNARSSFTGAAPIHWAAQDGRIELVNILLDAGADPSVQGVKIGGFSSFGQEGISVLRRVQQERYAASGIRAKTSFANNPAPKLKKRPRPPGPNYEWVPGHWYQRGTDWRWIPGHYKRKSETQVQTASITEATAPSWINQKIKVSGTAVVDTARYKSLGQAKLMARRVATFDARRNLLERVRDLRLDSQTTIRDVLAQDDFNGIIGKSYQVGSDGSDITYTVTVEIKLNDVYSYMKEKGIYYK